VVNSVGRQVLIISDGTPGCDRWKKLTTDIMGSGIISY